MMKRLNQLFWAVFSAALMTLLISCGGGGLIPDVEPGRPTTVLDAAETLPNGTVIETLIYRAMTDDEPLENGSKFELDEGQSVNFSARAWASLLQPDGTYKREEISEVDGLTFSWAYKGLDADNAAWEEEGFKRSFKQVVISWEDLPTGGRYDLSVRAEISPNDLVKYVNDRLDIARTNPPHNQGVGGDIDGGGGWNNNAVWAGGGFVAGLIAFSALAICPSDSAGIVIHREGEIIPPPPVEPKPYLASVTVDPTTWTGLVDAEKQFDGTCYDQFDEELHGGVESWTSSDEDVATVDNNGLVTAVALGVTTITYGCTLAGETETATATVTVIEEVVDPTNEDPIAVLTADPMTGIESVEITLDASGSTDDGEIVKYEWDTDGDGTYDEEGDSDTLTHTYLVGEYTPSVRVTDNDGATDVATLGTTIEVTEEPIDDPELMSIDLSPPSATLASGEEAQFTADSFDGDGALLTEGVVCEWSVSSGPGSIDQSGLYSAPSSVATATTATVKVVCTYDGKPLTESAIVTLIADGPTWGDDPFDLDLLLFSVTPSGGSGEEISLSVSQSEAQQIFLDVFYDGVHQESGIGGRYFTFSFASETNNLVTVDGRVDASGITPGGYDVTLTVTLQTAPTPFVEIITIPVTIVT